MADELSHVPVQAVLISHMLYNVDQTNELQFIDTCFKLLDERDEALAEVKATEEKSNDLKSKKRGLSLEEKREKMLQIFYDSQDFFLELEKSGLKKGVISESVKDVIQTLVDDDPVFKDKIGTSVRKDLSKITNIVASHLFPSAYDCGNSGVLFWNLPSCAGNQLIDVQHKLESDLQSSKNRYGELLEPCDSLKKGREESDEQEEALTELQATKQKYNDLKDERVDGEDLRGSIVVAQTYKDRGQRILVFGDTLVTSPTKSCFVHKIFAFGYKILGCAGTLKGFLSAQCYLEKLDINLRLSKTANVSCDHLNGLALASERGCHFLLCGIEYNVASILKIRENMNGVFISIRCNYFGVVGCGKNAAK